MAYCGPRGIPYTTWLAKPWDELSRAAALAWAARDADRCPGCGLHHSDLPDSGDLRAMPVVGEYHYCVGCDAKDTTPEPPGRTGDRKGLFHFRWRSRPPASGQ